MSYLWDTDVVFFISLELPGVAYRTLKTRKDAAENNMVRRWKIIKKHHQDSSARTKEVYRTCVTKRCQQEQLNAKIYWEYQYKGWKKIKKVIFLVIYKNSLMSLEFNLFSSNIIEEPHLRYLIIIMSFILSLNVMNC